MGNKTINLMKISFKTLFSQKFILSIIILVQIACCIVLLYGYSFAQTLIAVNSNYEKYNLDFADASSFLEIKSKITEFEKSSQLSDFHIFLNEEKTVVTSKITFFQFVNYGRLVNHNSPQNEIVVYQDQMDNADGFKLNDTLEMFDKEYIIVGINNRNYLSNVIGEINYNSVDQNSEVYGVTLINDGIRNKKEQSKYKNAIEKEFSYKVQDEEVDYSVVTSGILYFIIIITGIVLCMVSFAIGVKYIQDKRKHSFKVFNIIGLSKIKTYLWMMAEILLICAVVCIFSSILYYVLDILIFSKILLELTMAKPTLGGYFIVGTVYLLFVGTLATVISVNELFKNFTNKKKIKGE